MHGVHTLCTLHYSSKPVKVGVYYYVWYPHHWNGTKEWTVVDVPILGYYASNNESIIKQHLDWFKYAGIDFGNISWWGPNSYEDNATTNIWDEIRI